MTQTINDHAKLMKALGAAGAAGLVLGGASYVMMSQNQDVVKAAQTETQISQAHQNAIKKADAGVKKAVSAKVRRKSRRTVNKYVNNAAKLIKRAQTSPNDDISLSQTKTALTKILNTVKHPGIAHMRSARKAINAVSSMSTRGSLDRRYTRNMAKFVSHSTHKSQKTVLSQTNPVAKVKAKKSATKSTKTYTNNPLNRKLTADDRLAVKAINDEYAHDYTLDQLNELRKTNPYYNTNYSSPFINDIDNGKYKLSDIPGKDNLDRWQKLADHLGIHLTTGKRLTMSELNRLDKQQNTSKRAKIWSKCYKKYAFVHWVDALTNDLPRSQQVYAGEFRGLDNESKALSEYHRLADTKKQKAQRAKERKADEEESFEGAIYDPKTGKVIDTTKEYKKLVKSGMSRQEAQDKISEEYDDKNISAQEAQENEIRNQNLWGQFFH